MIYGPEEKNTDWGEDKVNIHPKEICLRVDICSVVFFSIQECDYNTIIVGLVSFELYWAQGLKDKEEEKRREKKEWVSTGSLYWRQWLIIYAWVTHWLNKNL